MFIELETQPSVLISFLMNLSEGPTKTFHISWLHDLGNSVHAIPFHPDTVPYISNRICPNKTLNILTIKAF